MPSLISRARGISLPSVLPSSRLPKTLAGSAPPPAGVIGSNKGRQDAGMVKVGTIEVVRIHQARQGSVSLEMNTQTARTSSTEQRYGALFHVDLGLSTHRATQYSIRAFDTVVPPPYTSIIRPLRWGPTTERPRVMEPDILRIISGPKVISEVSRARNYTPSGLPH
jgi:hypothetical protein